MLVMVASGQPHICPASPQVRIEDSIFGVIVYYTDSMAIVGVMMEEATSLARQEPYL